MQVMIYDKYFCDFYKVRRMVDYFTQQRLAKFKNHDSWRLDVWMDKKIGGSSVEPVSCGLKLKRPNKSEVFVKDFAESGDLLAKRSFRTLEKIIRREH